jgi:type 1 glutamine amidotransferase
MRHWIFLLAMVGVFVSAFCGGATAADAPAKIRVLLITGDDVAPAHDWRDISESTRTVLVDSGRFDVKICEDPLILESNKALDAYDVIVFTMYNASVPTITERAKKNLLDFVKGGKGFYVQHLASAAFAGWPEFGELCGRKWVMGTSGHGPREVFTARVVDKNHPITRGVEDFKIYDELYSRLQGDAPIHVLVDADSPWSHKTEPLLFVRDYGKGRVVHNAFGHDFKAIKSRMGGDGESGRVGIGDWGFVVTPLDCIGGLLSSSIAAE